MLIVHLLLSCIKVQPAIAKSIDNQEVWFTEKGSCEYARLDNHTHFISLVTNHSSTKGFEKGKQKVQEDIISSKCSGLPESQCDSIKRAIKIESSAFNPRTKETCVLGRVPTTILKDPTGRIAQERTLESDINNVLIKIRITLGLLGSHLRSS